MHISKLSRSVSSLLLFWIVVFTGSNISSAQQANSKSEELASCGPPAKVNRDDFVIEQTRLKQAFFDELKNSEKLKNHKIKVLRTILNDQPVSTSNDTALNTTVSFIVFDYTINKAIYYTVNSVTKQIISEERLTGRPQPSDEEIEESVKIIGSDPAFSNLLQADAKIVGGFIVDGPPKSPTNHRYMQMRIVSKDMKRTKKVIIVNLSEGHVVYN